MSEHTDAPLEGGPGYTARINELGFCAVRLHYSADPDKNIQTEDGARWFEHTRRLYAGDLQWEQEMEISWWVAAGLRVYPEFNETLHCIAVEGYRETKIIYRSWDFGWHAPACLIAQIDSKDRLVLVKEIVGHQQTTRQFAQKVIQQCTAWFPHQTSGYIDFCDPAGQQAKSTASEVSEVRDVDVLAALGIRPTWEYGWSRKDGRSLVHQLLVRRIDGTPSLYVNSLGCPITLQGFLGKYVYPPKKDGGAHDEPDETNHPWADIHAALRYLCTGLYTALGLRRGANPPPSLAATGTHGYGTPARRRRR